MPILLTAACEADHLGDYADLDPVILASLRTSADETALAAAVETQLTTRATSGMVRNIPAQMRRARPRTVLRAA